MRLVARFPVPRRHAAVRGPTIASLLPATAPAGPGPRPTPGPRPRPTPGPGPTPGPSPGPAPRPTPAAAAEKPARAKVDRPSHRGPDEPGDPLAAPTHTLKGIGPAFAERLAEKGLETVEDSAVVPAASLRRRARRACARGGRRDGRGHAGDVRREGHDVADGVRARQRWAEVRLAETAGAPATAVVRWWNVWAGIEKRMPPGCVVTLSTVIRKRDGRLELANPDILAIELADAELASPGKARRRSSRATPRSPASRRARLRAACQARCARVGRARRRRRPRERRARGRATRRWQRRSRGSTRRRRTSPPTSSPR